MTNRNTAIKSRRQNRDWALLDERGMHMIASEFMLAFCLVMEAKHGFTPRNAAESRSRNVLEAAKITIQFLATAVKGVFFRPKEIDIEVNGFT